ncbi:MAG: hypothetical protein KGS48_08875 [Bacteroidetes bacterium]|nr:hypothetical protein [Bacteroidota bacterium]
MPKRIPAFLLLFILSTPLSAQWRFQTGATGVAAYKVYDVGNVRWLCTASGLYRSNNSGKNFTKIQGLPDNYIIAGLLLKGDSIVLAVGAPDPNSGGASKTFLYWSVNQGARWESRVVNIQPENIYKEFRVYPDTMIIGTNSRLWRSTNGAQSFYQIGPDTINGLYKYAINDRGLFVLATGGLFRSTDRGDSWKFVRKLNGFGDVALSGDTVLVVSNADSIYYSTNRGDTWQRRPAFPAIGNNRLSTGAHGRFYSSFKEIYYTDDLGQNWQKLSTGYKNTFLGIYENENGAWALASGGLLRIDPAKGYLFPDQEGNRGGYNQYLVKGIGDRLYAFSSLYMGAYSTDAEHWSRLAALPEDQLPYDLNRRQDTLLVINNHHFYFSTNEGLSWTQVIDSLDTPNALALEGDVLLLGDQTGIRRSNSVLGPWKKVASAPNTEHLLVTPEKWFAVNLSGTLRTSTDKGLSWTVSAQLGGSSVYTIDELGYAAGKVFYFGFNGLYYSDASDGTNWVLAQGIPANAFYSEIVAYGQVLLMGTRGKGLFASTDGGAHWGPFAGFEGAYIPAVTLWQNHLVISVLENGLWINDYNLAPYHAYAFYDDNQNQMQDSGEGPYPGLIVQAKGGAYAASDSSGFIQVYGTMPEDSLIVHMPKYYTIVTPAQALLKSTTDTVQLAVYKQYVKDLRITLVNARPLVPGFNTDFNLICENIGSETYDAKVYFRFPPMLSLVSASLPPSSAGQDSALWILPQFNPGDIQIIRVTMQTASTVQIGTAVSTEAIIAPVDVDANPVDNFSGLRILVRGSFDPNDKTARKGERITPKEIEDRAPMEYFIRFQNTGTYPATFVRVIDTLSARFDPASFVFQGSSHPCRWNITGAGILEFFFDNIQLPDSTSDEPGSHGFVAFSIKPRPGLVLGDTLANTAFIYFDYNAPVQTNTTSTVVAELLSIFSPAAGMPRLNCFPNPAGDMVYVRLPEDVPDSEGRMWIWDVNGKLVQQTSTKSSEGTLSVPLTNWREGWYRVAWQCKKQLLWGIFLHVAP